LVSAAIKTDGTLWTWGKNASGQLGNNSFLERTSPIQTVSGGTNWKQVSTGDYMAAVKTDGTLWMWGNNYYGGLGDNTRTNRSSPVQTVAAGTNWKQVSVSNAGNATGAIKTDGTLWMWGRNNYGELGDNTTTAKSSPVQTVAGGTNWKQVSPSNGMSACIKTDGTLWLWGGNSAGALGDGTTTGRSSPVQTIAGGTNWKQVSAGSSVAGIRDDSADFGIGTL
jgi:alpha-tubulin suppressor-like RCC1 family protein